MPLLGSLVTTAVAASVVATPAAADPVAAGAPACTVQWAGPSAGAWYTAANWSPARVPGVNDVVCLPTTSSPTVTVTGTGARPSRIHVRALRTGTATLVVERGTDVAAGLVDASGGTLRGQGTVSPQNLFVRAGTTADLGCRQLATVDGVVAGTVVVRNGALLFNYGRLTLTGDAAVLDGGGSGRNAVRNGGALIVRGTARIEPAFAEQFDGGRLEVTTESRLTLVRFGDLDRHGRLTGGRYTIAGTLVVPQPVQVIGGSDLDVAATGRLLDATGASALGSLEAVVGRPDSNPRSTVALHQDLVDTASLSLFANLDFSVDGELTAPRVVVDTGSTLVAGTAVTTTGDAPGVVVRNEFDVRHTSKVVLRRGSVVTGGLLAGPGGRVTLDVGSDAPAVTHGDLDTTRKSATTALWPTVTTAQPALRVDGAATVGGTLRIQRHGPALPVGTATTLLTASGGVQGTYRIVDVDDPNGQTMQVTYTPTSVVVTVTGPAAG